MMKAHSNIEKKVLEFSQHPGPRYINQGKDSGEEFYKSYLKPWFEDALKNNCTLTIVLDGTAGYLSSFIDEAFGRLVYDYGRMVVEKNLIVKSELETIWNHKLENKIYPAWEYRREQHIAPENTHA